MNRASLPRTFSLPATTAWWLPHRPGLPPAYTDRYLAGLTCHLARNAVCATLVPADAGRANAAGVVTASLPLPVAAPTTPGRTNTAWDVACL